MMADRFLNFGKNAPIKFKVGDAVVEAAYRAGRWGVEITKPSDVVANARACKFMVHLGALLGEFSDAAPFILGVDDMKTFKLHWLGGSTEIIRGRDITDAMSLAGYGGGSLRALDHYEELKDGDA